MQSILLPDWSHFPTPARTLARIAARRDPERQLIGALAAALQFDDADLIDGIITAALAWPEQPEPLRVRKAGLLFALTSLLARARSALALRLAPRIPTAPGMRQVLVFDVVPLRQTFVWRVTPAYALITGRTPLHLPLTSLVEPYKRGQVDIDHQYVRQVLLRRRTVPQPILLLPHEHGLVRLEGAPYVILDGNHRVVSAHQRHRRLIPSYILTEAEARAVLVNHRRYPPYQA
ncbi:MAG: hypothetical protein H7Z42_06885 [Roseiflexaceae bacterium]|nr:hypothetical protein [Roseiflexaceae bacterium]